MAKRLRKVVIKRSKWARGNSEWFNTRKTQKYGLDPKNNSDAMLCCLGHARVALGIRNQRYAGSPAACPSSKWPTALLRHGEDTYLCEQMMAVNDDEHSSDSSKERDLTTLAAEAGLRFVFVD